jgi:hypothetical protein
MKFHKYENNKTCFYTLTLGELNNILCIKGTKYNKSTTLESIASIFPKSYSKRDTITIDKERLVAVRFFTSKRAAESQWILLFYENKLKYFHYFDGDD